MFHTGGDSTFLQLRDPADWTTPKKVQAPLAALPPGTQRLFRVISHHALVFTTKQDIAFTGAAREAALRPLRSGTHGYYPDFAEIRTGFVAAGRARCRGCSWRMWRPLWPRCLASRCPAGIRP